MEKTVAQYQNAFNSIVERLKQSESILAIMVFGSMVTGDLWDESDIDLFVVMDEKDEYVQNIFTEENEVPVHIKLMGKDKFLQLYEEDLRGGFIHRIFASSKLVFSKDSEITMRYDNGRYYPDFDRERWNMVYLGKLLKNIGVCKKYVFNDGMYIAYAAAVRCVEEFSKLYVNACGYMISKDAMKMAVSLDDNFRNCVDELFFNKGDIKQIINNTLEFIQKSLEDNIKNISSILVKFMSEKDAYLSAEDIKKDELFKGFNIDFEEILSELWKKNIIKKDNRELKDNNGKVLLVENVYFI